MIDIVWQPYLSRSDIKKASLDQVETLEKRISLKIPPLLASMLTSHGGECPLNLIPRYSNGEPMFIECIYHMYHNDLQYGSYSVLYSYETLIDEGYEKLIPFSRKEEVYLCLDYSQAKSFPSVVFLFRGDPVDDPDHKMLLANSFDEFLEKYTIPSDQVDG